MNEPKFGRRRALQVGGATGLAALAGCAGLFGGGGGTPGYADYVPGSSEQVGVSYVDIEALNKFEEDSNSTDSGSQLGDIEDPLLALSAASVFAAGLSAFVFQGTGLEPIANVSNDDSSGFETEVDEIISSNDAFVLSGDVSTDEIVDQLTTASDSQFATQYERTGENGGFELYQGTGETTGEEGPPTIAVSGGDIVAADAPEPVNRVVETLAGERTRAVDEYDTFEWVLSNAGDHQILTAGHGPQVGESDDQSGGQNFPALSGGQSSAAGLSYDGDRYDGEAAVVYESAEALESARSEAEDSFGAAGEDSSFDFGDDRFSMSATYSDSAL